MIKARIGTNPKILFVFDNIQADVWKKTGKISGEGIMKLLQIFKEAGITMEDISATCLADVTDKPKASDYKEKIEYNTDLFETYGFNVVIPVGSGAFDKMSGIKGIAKYFGKTLYSKTYTNMKLLPCPTPAQAKYDPGILNTIAQVARIAAKEKEFPEIIEVDKIETHYTIIDNIEQFKSFISHYKSEAVPVLSYDLETTGLYFNRDEITTIQMSHRVGYSYLIPCKTIGEYPAAPNPWSDEEWDFIVSELKELFTDYSKTVIGHNKKFDDKFIYYHWGIPLNKKTSWDTMYASFLLNENTPNGLKECTCEFTDLGDYELPLEEFKTKYCKEHKIKKKEFSYANVPFDLLAEYALTDADSTFRLYEYFKVKLVEEDMEGPFGILRKMSYLFTIFELNGWPLDIPYGNQLKAELEAEIAELEKELLESKCVRKAELILGAAKLKKDNEKRKNKLEQLKTPFVFNLGSTPQKKTLFFDVLGLKSVKVTKKKQPAVDKEAVSIWMREVPEHREFLKLVQHYSELKKFLSTYVIGVLNKAVNGRVHPTYNAIGAKTGRASSCEPSWMNLPARGDERKKKLVKRIKRMVKAPEGQILNGSDLGAIEMRWACIISGDKKLEQIFIDGLDIHGAIAKDLFDYIVCHPNEVKKLYEFERNDVSKTCQFLSVYLGSGDALAKKVNESIAERQDMAKAKGVEAPDFKMYTKEMGDEILKNYFKKYNGLKRYIDETTRFILENGYVKSIFGYKRRLPAAFSDDEGAKNQAIRQGVNQTFQNPASVSLLLALYNMQEEIEEKNLKIQLLGSIHDAGYCQSSVEDKLLTRDLLTKHLTAPPIPDCPIPITCECEWGVSWDAFSEDFGTALIDEESDDEEDTEEDEEQEVA